MAWLLLLWLCLLAHLRARGSARDVSPMRENYLPDYRLYHNVSSVHQTIQRLHTGHADRVRLHRTFRSRAGQPIPVLRLPPSPDASAGREPPLRVLLVYGEHAREFLPVESGLHLVERLVARPGWELARLLRRHFDVYVIPLLNPDGRLVVEKRSNYCWRGTGSGVDLARNFDWEFGAAGKMGSSGNRRDEEFRGHAAFSEPEARLVRDLSLEVKLNASVDFHSGIRHIYVPFSDTTSRRIGRRPAHLRALLALTERMKLAMGSDPKHAFQAGPAATLNDYTSDGTLFDFLAGVQHVPASLAVELWGVGDQPGLACFDLFNPRSERLQAELDRLLPLYEAFFTGLWALRANFSALITTSPQPLRRPEVVPPYPLMALLGCVLLAGGLLVRNWLRRSGAGLLVSGRKRVINLRSFSARFASLTSLKSV